MEIRRERRQKGFTLLEVLIAVVLLSVTAGIMLRIFLVSGRVAFQSSEKEEALELAKETMELFKTCSLAGLMQDAEEGGVYIQGEKWRAEEEKDAYIFTKAEAPEEEIWQVQVRADYGRYQAREKDGSWEDNLSGINLYEMPDLRDVAGRENIVIAPEYLERGDQDLEERLMEAAEDVSEEEEGDFSQEGDIRKFLEIVIDEEDGGQKLKVSARLSYTLQNDGDIIGDGEGKKSVEKTVYDHKVTLYKTDREIKNTVYIFLPEAPVYDGISIFSEKRGDGLFYTVYLAAPDGGFPYPSLYERLQIQPPEEMGAEIFSNIPKEPGGETEAIKREPSYNRLYALEVSVWRQDGKDGEPGEEMVTLTSSKRE